MITVFKEEKMGMNDNTEDYITLLEIWDRKDSNTDEVLAAFHKDAALFGRAIWWALVAPGGWGNYMSPKEVHQLIRALEKYSEIDRLNNEANK